MIFTARVAMDLEVPWQMVDAVRQVLDGEYEAGFDGVGLEVLDLGANVGSFALWASARWPESRVTCFEPHPATFGFLQRNTAGRHGVACVNAAVFPGGLETAAFTSRYDGDGESTLELYAADTFGTGVQGQRHQVRVVDPATLPSPDVVKLDIEGGEGDVLDHLDLSRTSLVLLEFQNRKNRDQVVRRLSACDFEQVGGAESSWAPLLEQGCYRPELASDVYGRIFAARRGLVGRRLVSRR